MRRTALVLAALLLMSACGSTTRTKTAAPPVTTTTVPVTTTTVPTPPLGQFFVATPVTSPLQYSATPGGPPTGTVPTATWGGPTVRPVISVTDSWVQIGLDTRPNLSTGWVPRSAITLAITPYRVEISISQRTLTLFQGGQAVYTSPVGVGKPQWPTPLGRTFIDAVVATPKFQLYIYGPTVYILGSHSDVFTEFDGGDGTVAIHGYPSDPGSTKGVASSHGCVRSSPQTIDALKVVPLGSPVDVVA
ncbi:MAG TPA: L,D-transpeptidase [Acidimicrobiales bacterium]|nr:L,D-transpeptidase [Acidimicrobiales bacterium]